MEKPSRSFLITAVIIVGIIVVGQVVAYLLNPASWMAFMERLPVILAMIAFWGPIIAVIAGLFMWAALRLLGFSSLEVLRQESVEQNNPAPAIIFTGTLIAKILFLMLVILP
jgi:hypothetical protein